MTSGVQLRAARRRRAATDILRDLDTADPGLYYQLQFERGDHQTWKIDMILAIKEAALERGEQIHGIRVYQAVLSGRITGYPSFLAWNASTADSLSHWSPAPPDSRTELAAQVATQAVTAS